MHTFWYLLLYIGSCVAVLLTVLFGQLRVFSGTPVGFGHWALTSGLPAFVRWIAKQCCGSSAASFLHSVERYCLHSRNPIVQVLFILLVFSGYYLYCREIFALLPQPWAPEWHEHTGAVSIGLVLVSFWVVCATDPGYINAENLEQHLLLFPSGRIPSRRADCWTCKRTRPVRSKHCPLCNRCVARFDHHCAWVNNCIGLLNLRYFLVFLAAMVLLCLYGVVLGVLVLRGVTIELGIYEAPFMDYATGTVILLRERSFRNSIVLLTFLWTRFSIQVLLLFFLGLAGLCVSCFLAYHLWLIARGVTTYETFKKREASHGAGRTAEAYERFLNLRTEAVDSDITRDLHDVLQINSESAIEKFWDVCFPSRVFSKRCKQF